MANYTTWMNDLVFGRRLAAMAGWWCLCRSEHAARDENKSRRSKQDKAIGQTVQSRARTLSQQVHLYLSEPPEQLITPQRNRLAPGRITRPRRAHAHYSGFLPTPCRQSLPRSNLCSMRAHTCTYTSLYIASIARRGWYPIVVHCLDLMF